MALQSFNTLMVNAQSKIMTGLKGDASVIYRDKATETLRPGLDALVAYEGGADLIHKHLPTGDPKTLVTLCNDAVTGISLNDDGKIIGDSIWVAPQPGVDPKWCTIVERISADHNLVTWEVR
jgi:hypothetical protein